MSDRTYVHKKTGAKGEEGSFKHKKTNIVVEKHKIMDLLCKMTERGQGVAESKFRKKTNKDLNIIYNNKTKM